MKECRFIGGLCVEHAVRYDFKSLALEPKYCQVGAAHAATELKAQLNDALTHKEAAYANWNEVIKERNDLQSRLAQAEAQIHVECRFNMEARCTIHSGSAAAPIICTHAAAELERRVEEQAAHIKAMQETKSGEVAILESRLATLEEEKAQAEQKYNREVAGTVALGMELADTKECLTQAEATAEAMWEALEANLAIVKKAWADYNWPLPSEAFGPEGAIAMGEAALSPPATLAAPRSEYKRRLKHALHYLLLREPSHLADEVAKLREVARKLVAVADAAHDHLFPLEAMTSAGQCQVVKWCRDALAAVREEEGK